MVVFRVWRLAVLLYDWNEEEYVNFIEIHNVINHQNNKVHVIDRFVQNCVAVIPPMNPTRVAQISGFMQTLSKIEFFLRVNSFLCRFGLGVVSLGFVLVKVRLLKAFISIYYSIICFSILFSLSWVVNIWLDVFLLGEASIFLRFIWVIVGMVSTVFLCGDSEMRSERLLYLFIYPKSLLIRDSPLIFGE